MPRRKKTPLIETALSEIFVTLLPDKPDGYEDPVATIRKAQDLIRRWNQTIKEKRDAKT